MSAGIFTCCGCGEPYIDGLKQCECATSTAARWENGSVEYMSDQGPDRARVHQVAEAIFNELPEDIRRQMVTDRESDFYPVAIAAITAYRAAA